MYDNFQIQFGREEFCLVIDLKLGVEYSADYDDEDKPIPFRRQVFPSCLDGKHRTGKNIKDLIKRKSFKKLDDDDAISLCCIGILQLVLLGVEDRHAVTNWILRLANDRGGWDDYPWGQNEYYTRHMRYPRIVAWTSNKKFYRHMLRDFLHGRVPAERLIPDEVEAGSDFQEQRSGLDQMMKQGKNIFDSMKKYMEDLNVGTGANREPIIIDQHYGISDLSGFQSIHGGPSSFKTPTNYSFFNIGEDDVVITGVHDTGIYFTYENVDPNKVYMPINVGGNHWVTGAVNLPHFVFYVFDSMESERTRLLLEHQIKAWTPVINGILRMRGYSDGYEQQPHNFILSYNLAKDEMRKAYEECRDIPLVQRALIENFLKIESELDQQMQNALFRKASKLEKQIRDKNKWLQQL
ncbi:phospholipase-like protein [Tanacetum coccineum]